MAEVLALNESLYILFAFDEYYPGGGWEDFKLSAFDLDSLIRMGQDRFSKRSGGTNCFDYYQIVKVPECDIIYDLNRKQFFDLDADNL